MLYPPESEGAGTEGGDGEVLGRIKRSDKYYGVFRTLECLINVSWGQDGDLGTPGWYFMYLDRRVFFLVHALDLDVLQKFHGSVFQSKMSFFLFQGVKDFIITVRASHFYFDSCEFKVKIGAFLNSLNLHLLCLVRFFFVLLVFRA